MDGLFFFYLLWSFRKRREAIYCNALLPILSLFFYPAWLLFARMCCVFFLLPPTSGSHVQIWSHFLGFVFSSPTKSYTKKRLGAGSGGGTAAVDNQLFFLCYLPAAF